MLFLKSPVNCLQSPRLACVAGGISQASVFFRLSTALYFFFVFFSLIFERGERAASELDASAERKLALDNCVYLA